jgi:hypothetical protein
VIEVADEEGAAGVSATLIDAGSFVIEVGLVDPGDCSIR